MKGSCIMPVQKVGKDNYIEKLKENSIQTESKSVNIGLYSESAVAEGTITTIEPAFKKEQFIVDECD